MESVRKLIASLGTLALLTLAISGCGAGATESPAPTTPPAGSLPIVIVGGGGSILHGSAADLCAGTTYSRCVDGVTTAVNAGWTRFAICEYGNGQGDVVRLDPDANAEDECSGRGVISPSKVFDVFAVPEAS